ncbi:lysine transporter LysE [Georgenia yuyongxinii]|uniref:Lysine transporter LysE n=1 Tax=Georgenia yuyongxinii TaxID=2589797 RepID=A0A5B8BYS9_9MICO|nr:LysE family transporter [Georgenia yuyongxinii]QDC23423.1 lysine transporter LysE [Georgenia yuyongxinii]
MSAALSGGVAAGYAIAIPVGAIAAYLITLGAQHGWRTATGGALGAAVVDGLYAAVAVFLGGLVAPAIAAVAEPLRWSSAAVLLVLAAWLVRPAFVAAPARPGTTDAGPPARSPADSPAAVTPAGTPPARPATVVSPARAFAVVLGLTLVNPTTVVYFAALVTGSVVRPSAGPAERLTFVLGAFLASASWQLLLAGAGSTAGRFLAGPAGRRWTAIVGGGVVALLAVKVAVGV